MSDTAAFFANKKKKKAFKFNANLIDAATVTTTVHVDAPALSTDQDHAASGGASQLSGGVAGLSLGGDDRARGDDSEQWADVAVPPTTASAGRKGAASAVPLSAEVLDIKSIEPKRGTTGNIAEKLRVEETKAQLAAAREGMEREAARIKEEQERKEQEKKDVAAKSRFGSAAAASSGTTGGKWVPSRLRAGGLGASPHLPSLHHATGKLDVQDEELFPDLAAAKKILEQKEKSQQAAFKIPKKTPVGGGASWASKPPAAVPVAPAPVTAPSETQATEVKDSTAADAAAAATADTADDLPANHEEPKSDSTPTTDVTLPKIAPKKKKKKDLSTFKPGG